MAELETGHDHERSSPFQVSDWQVEPATDRLIRGEREVKLEPRVMDLLVCLATKPGQVMTREELEASVWSGMVVGYDALTSAMIKLRKAFEDDFRDPQIIETVAKRGYRLIAPVTFPLPENRRGGAQNNIVSSKRETIPRRRIMTYLAAVVAGLVISSVLVSTLLIEQQDIPQPAIARNITQPGIVVLPFVNLSDDPAQEYFSDGIAEDLIVDLSRYSGLFVISRRSSFMYKQNSADIQMLARDLGVGYVVEGSVRRNGDQLRINVQLVDAATGINLWARRFDRRTLDLFAVQDEVRRNIINALSVTLTDEERKREQRRYTASFEAYDLFLQGQSKLVTRASAADSQQAQEFMERAIALDGNFARAHAALALIHADAYRFNWSVYPEQTRQQALKIGERAVQLDPHSPQAHWILGYIYLFLFEDHTRAIEMGKRAIELAPHDNDGYNLLAVSYSFGDDPAKAKLIIQELMNRNPRYSAMVPSVLGLANLRLGNYTEALAAYDDSLLINPTRIQGNAYKALALFRMGRIDDAEFQIDQLYSLHPDFDVHVWAMRQPFKDKAIVKRMVNDLLSAGVRDD